MAEPIVIKGIREFQRALRDLDDQAPKQLRLIQNDAAGIVVDWARPRIPSRTGAAAASLRLASSQRETRVRAGGRKAPYYAWLDFGGKTGPQRSVDRPFYRQGRYVYPGLSATRERVQKTLQDGMTALAQSAGLEVE